MTAGLEERLRALWGKQLRERMMLENKAHGWEGKRPFQMKWKKSTKAMWSHDTKMTSQRCSNESESSDSAIRLQISDLITI